MSALQLFGPSRKEIWHRLCREMGAEYIDRGFWKGDLVRVTENGWTITLDTYFCGATESTYTRIRAPFTSRDQFEFRIYRRGFFSDLGKRLGMQDIEIGHSGFDQNFIIKGNDEAKLRRLFKNARIRDFVSAQPQIDFKLETDKVTPNAELQFTVSGVIKDIERLKQLFELFGESLDQLNKMGTAAPPMTRP